MLPAHRHSTIRAATVLKVSPPELFNPMVPGMVAGILTVVGLAYLLGRSERKRLLRSPAGAPSALLHGREHPAQDVDLVAVELGPLQEPAEAVHQMGPVLGAIAKVDLDEHLIQMRVEPLHGERISERLLARRLGNRDAACAKNFVGHHLHGHGEVERSVFLAGRNAQQRVRRRQVLVVQTAVLAAKHHADR